MRNASRMALLFVALALLAAPVGLPIGDGCGDGGEPHLDLWAPDVVTDDAAPPDRGPDTLAGCDPRNFTLEQSPPPDVYLVVDRSGSMADPGSDPQKSKWAELRAAVDVALSNFQHSIRFGLLLFPTDTRCATTGPQVPMDTFNRLAVIGVLDDAVPAGGTPTAAALNNAAQSLRDFGGDGQKFLILATDGGPNCNYALSADPSCSCASVPSSYCCTNHPQSCAMGFTCLDEDRVLGVIEDLHDEQIDTFIIGLAGTSAYEPLLNQLAVAGGRAQSGATKYFPAQSQTELEDALQSIAGELISCTLDFEEAPEYPDLVKIFIDGAEVPRDDKKEDGWEYVDTSLLQVELYGPACEGLQDGHQHVVTATFACEVD